MCVFVCGEQQAHQRTGVQRCWSARLWWQWCVCARARARMCISLNVRFSSTARHVSRAAADGGGAGLGPAEVVVTLERFDSDATFTAMFDWARVALTELGLAEGDSVLMRLDVQGRQAASILEGIVEQMTTTSLRVRLPKGLAGWGEDAQVSGEQHAHCGQASDRGGESGDCGQASNWGHAHPPRKSPALWRVDRCEYGNSWRRARGALTRFFSARSAATEGGVVSGGEVDRGQTEASRYAAKHRRLIVDLEVRESVCVRM